MAPCPICGTEVPRTQKYCSKCGSAMKLPRIPRPKSGRSLGLPLVVLGLVLLAAAAGICFLTCPATITVSLRTGYTQSHENILDPPQTFTYEYDEDGQMQQIIWSFDDRQIHITPSYLNGLPGILEGTEGEEKVLYAKLTWDEHQQLVSWFLSLDQHTYAAQYTYDADGNRLTAHFQSSNQYRYDNWTETCTYENGICRSTDRVTRNGEQIASQYTMLFDPQGNLLQMSFYDTTLGIREGALYYENTYDDQGLLLQAVEYFSDGTPMGYEQYIYEDHRLIRKSYHSTTGSKQGWTDYAYNQQGMLISEKEQSASGSISTTVHYTYQRNRITLEEYELHQLLCHALQDVLELYP